MTTSSTYSVQYTRDDLVTAAHYKLGVIAEGQTLSATQLTRGTMALNMSLALLRAKGMPLWERNTYTFSTTSTVSSYNIGTGQTFNTPYPLKLLQCYRTSNGTRIDMDIEADYNFNQLPVNSTGIPIKVTYQPKVNLGILKLWPTPDTTAASSTFTIVYQQPFQYFINSTDTADLPEEWYLPLVYRTASILAPEWGIPIGDRNMLMGEAEKYTEDALSMGGEDASMFIQPYMQPGWGEDRRS
jgi:hypothetical protein